MTRALAGQELADQIRARFAETVVNSNDSAVWVKPDKVAEVAQFLRDAPELVFNYLNSISAVDYVDHFEVVYHLTSFKYNHSAIVKAKVGGRESPSLPSVIGVWPGADLQEREIWDLMGVRFEGHPNPKRILLWEGFPGHPLRRDFEDR